MLCIGYKAINECMYIITSCFSIHLFAHLATIPTLSQILTVKKAQCGHSTTSSTTKNLKGYCFSHVMQQGNANVLCTLYILDT